MRECGPLCATSPALHLPAMPLHVRLRNDHYPHDERSPRLDDYVVLSGGLEVGSFHRSGSGPSEGRWSWAHAIGTDDRAFAAADMGLPRSMPHADHLGVPLDARARQSARATGRKARSAEPRAAGRDRRAFAADAAYDRETAQWLGMVRSERRVFVRSGELIFGVLNRATHGPESWSWFLTGVSRPHDIGRGTPTRKDAAFDDFASCWKRWLDWAGLEQVGMLERGAKR